MAAYAALLSLEYIIEQLQHHSRPPISIDQNQVHSLIKSVNFLQNFLEDCSYILNEETDALQILIVEAAYAAEDVIETHIVDQIFAQYSKTDHRKRKATLGFCEDLQRVIQNMDFIEKEVMKVQQQKHKRPKHANSQRLVVYDKGMGHDIVVGRHNTVVGLDDVKTQVKEKLAGGQIDRQLITIVGMGGIGKTTLAKIVYEDPFIVEYFHIHAWASLSQEYSVKGILLELLLCLGSQESSSEESEERLGERLYKSLCGKRYLIVMDDTWSIEAWDSVRLFFPDNKNGSRIMITTRRSDVALHLSSHEERVIKMEFLDENVSWNLFCQIAFGDYIFPDHELWEIGKTIARNCQGLPLAIVVIGRLLARSERTMGYWEWILENLNSIVNIEDNERYFKILHLSYVELPIHLKPCFLYMGAFGENREIRVSCLIKLWVAEGFLKPITGKSLEDVAQKYLEDLIDRNLVLVHKRGSNGKIKICNMHDVLREVCLVEAEKHKFLYVRERHSFSSPQGIDTQRRIAIHSTEFLDALHSESVARSFICDILGVLPSLNCKLLRILKAVDKYSACLLGEYSVEAIIFQLVNSCYLAICADWNPINSRIPSSMYLLWKLQTLIIKGAPENTIAPSEIWKMSQLRHVEVDELYLPDPPSGNKDNQDDNSILGNLQTLSRIRNFKCSEEVVMRIPNIKKLKISYSERFSGSHYCLNNLARLDNLVSLRCDFYPSARPSRSDLMQNLSFSHSLMKLTLKGCNLHWEDISTKISVLPFLQVLKLRENSFIGPVWEPLEAQFCKLNWLEISKCDDLELWEADDDHFPRLEHLVLQNLTRLKEIPSGFSDIPTLESIQLINCSLSIITSACRIREVQLSLGNEGPKVQIRGKLPLMPEQFLKGIQTDVPTLKTLQISNSERLSGSHYCLNNLARLNNLASLCYDFSTSARPSKSDLIHNLSFSHFLMKLTLKGCNLHWEDISTKISVLPFLQVLKLRENSFIGPVWEPLEAQFCKLNWLEISKCDDLELWEADDNHFPRLEHLVLQNLTRLKEIPSGFSDITTLESIQLINCSLSIITSACRIREVQLSLGNEGPKVQIRGKLPSMPEQFLKGIQTDVQPSVVEEEAGEPSIVEEEKLVSPQLLKKKLVSPQLLGI